jgi:signal transduction histidine kinase
MAEIVAASLLCVLLFAIARFMERPRAGEERADALVAELREARAAETRAAAVAERGRIAAELHDAGLALHCGAQEALTNVARHAPGAHATVVLR